jgi:hypothetical protein
VEVLEVLLWSTKAAILVIFTSLEIIAKNFVGSGDFLELLAGCLLGVHVGMKFLGEYKVGFLDVLLAGVDFDAEDLVVVDDCHVEYARYAEVPSWLADETSRLCVAKAGCFPQGQKLSDSQSFYHGL